MSQPQEINIMNYRKIGTGRPAPNGEYSQTVTYMGRYIQTINFIAAKTLDIKRQADAHNLYFYLNNKDHPHIIKFYEWNRTGNHYWFIVEYCPGGSLHDLLEQDVRLPESIIKIFATDILDALFYLHTLGIFLRDFQPRNIMINECGSLKISDFTKAESVNKRTPLNLLSDPDMIEYLAPELLMENAIASFASDFYSFGVLLYRMGAGQVPFKAIQAQDPTSPLFTEDPPVLPGYSSEYNDLIQSLLRKDPTKRPKWNEIIKHPFWGDMLAKIPKSNSPTDFDCSKLPNLPTFDPTRQSSLLKTTSSIVIPSKGFESARISTQNAPKSLESLILTSDIFQPQPLFLNPAIEIINLPEFRLEELKIKYDITSKNKTEIINAFTSLLKSVKESANPKKYGYISYLISKTQLDYVSDAIAETESFSDILQMAVKQKLSTARGLLILYGGIARNAHNIAPVNLTEEALLPLKILMEKELKVARKAISALGEIAFYMASTKAAVVFPSFFEPCITQCITNSTDDIMQHYGFHIISCIAPLQKCSSLFDMKKLEENLMKKKNLSLDKPAMLERYAIALCEIYQHHNVKPSNEEHLEEIISTLFMVPGNSSGSCKQLALMLAVSAKVSHFLKPELGKCLTDIIEDVKLKSILCVCHCFSDDLQSFLKISYKFYYELEKFSKENLIEVEIASQWTAQIAWKILKGNDLSLYQIIMQALTVKVCREKMWTIQFQNTFCDKLKQLDFNNPDALNALQVLEVAAHEGVCTYEQLTCISKAFTSSEKDTIFLSLKIVADMNYSSTVVNNDIIQFVLDKILPLAPVMLQNKEISEENLIGEQVLKILSFTADSDHKCVHLMATQDILPLIFERLSTSSPALRLTYNIVQYSGEIIDNFVKAGLLEAISDTVRNKGIPDSFLVLLSLLNPIVKQLTNNPENQQVQNVIQNIAKLADLTVCCAERLFTGHPKADSCLLSEIFIFSSLNSAKKCLIADAFPALSERLRESKFVQKLANLMKKVVDMLIYVTTKASGAIYVISAMKSCKDFLLALEECIDSPIKELGVSCDSLLKIIRASS